MPNKRLNKTVIFFTTDNTKQDRHVCVQMSIFCACLASYKANRVIALHFVGLEPVADVDFVRIALGESLCLRRA